MTRICHVTSAHNMDDVRIFEKECVSLAKKSIYEVFLAGPGTEERIYKGVHLIGCGEKPAGRRERMLKFARRVVDRAIELNADVYHIHDPELLRYVLRFKDAGKKVIFDSHENVLDSIEEKHYIPKPLRKLVKLYYGMIQRRVFPKIDGIVVVSPQMVLDADKFNRNVYLIGNYPIIDEKNYKDCDEYVRGRMVFAGGISDQWSHQEIIDAIDEVDGIEYHMIGSGPQQYIDKLKTLSGWRRTVYHGKVDFKTAQQKLEKAHFCIALLKPSRNTFGTEGTLGNTKLFEAMEKRKPVIATDFKLWREVVEGNECGIIVNPGKKEELVAAMRRIMSMDEEEIKAMGENGRKAVESKYNWGKCEEVLYDMYDNL